MSKPIKMEGCNGLLPSSQLRLSISAVGTSLLNRMHSTWSRWEFCCCRHTGGFPLLAPHTADTSSNVALCDPQLPWICGDLFLPVEKSAFSCHEQQNSLVAIPQMKRASCGATSGPATFATFLWLSCPVILFYQV